MPKPVKKAARKPTKRPSNDPMVRARQLMAEHMVKAGETAAAPTFAEQLSAHMARLGAKGGKISGAKRMTNLTDKQRKDIAKKAAEARWGNRKDSAT